jgi:hypothetical protein
VTQSITGLADALKGRRRIRTHPRPRRGDDVLIVLQALHEADAGEIPDTIVRRRFHICCHQRLDRRDEALRRLAVTASDAVNEPTPKVGLERHVREQLTVVAEVLVEQGSEFWDLSNKPSDRISLCCWTVGFCHRPILSRPTDPCQNH